VRVAERTFAGALSQWLELHTLGRKPRAQQFNREIVSIIQQHWPAYLNAPTRAVTPEEVTLSAQRVTHYCPSRWNAIVSALRFHHDGIALAAQTAIAREREAVDCIV
jgi:hypothetical protein